MILRRLFEWIFFNVHSEEVSDDERAVYLNGLHEILANDGGKSPYTAVMPVSLKHCSVKWSDEALYIHVHVYLSLIHI